MAYPNIRLTSAHLVHMKNTHMIVKQGQMDFNKMNDGPMIEVSQLECFSSGTSYLYTSPYVTLKEHKV